MSRKGAPRAPMRPESLVASIASQAKAGANHETLAARLEEYVREVLNHERREIAVALMSEDLPLDENALKAWRHDLRAGLESGVRRACVALVRERLEGPP